MKKSFIATILILMANQMIFAQGKYFTRSGTLSFFSGTPVEDIEAKNHQASCILDAKSGEIAVSAQMKGFEFERALMQEHFNENYVESHKFPKANFKGNIANFSSLIFENENAQDIIVTGILSIHGVDKEIKTSGTMLKKGDTYVAEAKFKVKPSDFDIKIPGAVIKNIAEEIEVSVDLQLEPYAQ